MRDGLKLTFGMTDDYIKKGAAHAGQAKFEATKLAVPIKELENKTISIDFVEKEIYLQYWIKEKMIEKKIPFIHILRCVEFGDGILLELTKKKYLFLPVLENEEHDEKLQKVLLYIRKNSYRKFEREQRLDSKSVSNAKKNMFRLIQIYRGKNILNVWERNALILLTIVCFYFGSILVSSALSDRVVERSEAIYVEGTYRKYEIGHYSGRYRGRSFVNITLESGRKEEVFTSKYFVDSLRKMLNNINSGADVKLLVHPKNLNIIELVVEGKEILNFDKVQEHIRKGWYMWVILIVFMYGTPIYFWMLYRKELKSTT